MTYRSILKPLVPRVGNKEDPATQVGCLVKKEVPRTFSHESFFTEKDCKKLTYEDFLIAVLEFGANAVDASGDDLRGYLTHLIFMCKMAATKRYDQHVHIAYDKAIRLHAEDIGWPAFKENIRSVANLYYDEEYEERQHDELDQVESDSEQFCLEDEGQSNEHRMCCTSETLELQCEKDHNYAIHRKDQEIKFPDIETIDQSSTVSTDPHNMGGQAFAEDTEYSNVEYFTGSFEIPVVEQITRKEPSMRQKGKRKLFSKHRSRKDSTQPVLLGDPTDKVDTPSDESPAHSSVASKRSKLQEARLPQKRYTCSQCGEQFPQVSRLKNHLRIHTLEPKEIAPIAKDSEIQVVEQLTKGEPSMRQKGKRRAFSKHKSRIGSSQPALFGNPLDKLDIQSEESSAHSSVISKRSKLKEAQLLQKRYTCSQCGEQFPQVSRLKNHLRIHILEPKEMTQIAKDKLKKHLKTHSQEPEGKTHICSYCSKELSSAKALKAHLLRHTVGPPAKMHLCPQCGKKFRTGPDFQVHMRNHTGERPYSCIKCGRKLISLQTLNKHMKTHTEEKKCICSYCGKLFLQLSQLSLHTRIHTGEKPFVCSYCGKKFRLSGHLRGHVRSHTGEKPYTCSECGKGFTLKGTLRKHKLMHTGEKPHKCPYCSKECRQRNVLKEHIEVWHVQKHSGNRGTIPENERNPHTCSDCGRKFEYLATLKVHMITHTGGDPLKCPECGEQCTSEAGLRFHMMIHTQEKPFKCSDCGKLFLRPGNLHNHQRIHKPERPNVCCYCSKSFTQKADLEVHIKIHTGDKPYLCSECGKEFGTAAYLRKHKKFIHAEAILSEQQNVYSTDELLADCEVHIGLAFPGVSLVNSS